MRRRCSALLLLVLLNAYCSHAAWCRLRGRPRQLAQPATVDCRRCSRPVLLGRDVDQKLVAADVTLVFGFSFARTLSVILASPDFPGWAAPIKTDPVRLTSTLYFAGEWALAWLVAGLLLDTFAPGLDEDSALRVGPIGALRCFALSAVIFAATALSAAAVSAPLLPPAPLQLNFENVAGAVGIGVVLVAWRQLVAENDYTRFW